MTTDPIAAGWHAAAAWGHADYAHRATAWATGPHGLRPRDENSLKASARRTAARHIRAADLHAELATHGAPAAAAVSAWAATCERANLTAAGATP